MRIAVTGSNGLLGGAFKRIIPGAEPSAQVFRLTRGDLDITDRDACLRVVGGLKPDVLINSAAYSAVDKAEAEPEAAYAVNSGGAANLAEAAAMAGAKFVHLSTDYVFDGEKGAPYTEDDPPSPACVYGASKAEGEKKVLEKNPESLIVRSAWLYGHDGPNFVLAMLKKGRELGALRVVRDQTGSPTYADDLAGAVLALIRHDAKGIVHAVNSGWLSWYELAVEALRIEGMDDVKITPVTSDEYKTPARRPRDSRLDTSLYEKITGAPLRGWKDALAEFLREHRLLRAG